MLCDGNFLIVVLLILVIIHVRIYFFIKYKHSWAIIRQKSIIIVVILLTEIRSELRKNSVRLFAEIRAYDKLVEAEHIVVKEIRRLDGAPGRSVKHGAIDNITSFLTFFSQVQANYLRS